MNLNPSILKSFAGWPAATESRSCVGARASRFFRVNSALGASGLLAAATTLGGGLGSVHVIPSSRADTLTILGAGFTRPNMNGAAIVLLVLGMLAGAALAVAVRAAVAGSLASWRLRRAMATRCVRREGDLFVYEAEEPEAFCAGLLRPQIYISTGALRALSGSELSAVVAHERHHARRRDPLRIAIGRVVGRALFWLPVADLLHKRHCAMAELAADEFAVSAQPGGSRALASALLVFADEHQPNEAVGIAPERVEHLIGRPPDCSLPAATAGAGLALSAFVTAAALLLAQLASAHASLGLPFLSARPCLVVVGLMTAALGTLPAAHMGRRLSPRLLRAIGRSRA
jgi:hypothetical protein